jgi:uncharacterized protein
MWYEKTALVLSAVGAINWGLSELDFNIVDLILGSWPIVVSIVYYIIALCGLFALYKIFK